ncbi:MAG: PQQ-dependent sugar dehydrogenase, partial [Thermoproteota archaeon]|nr:PQQ-dependent sugar dehydrogenase [Thermoproteota archaeon]
MILFLVTLPAFTHLWNPTHFPAIYIDENHYMRRAVQVMGGMGPQESILIYDHPYDHPYFGQVFLAFMLKLAGYDNIMNPPSPSDSKFIESVYVTPRLIMGILSIVDTLLVFKIGELLYNRNVGFVAGILFAVMPLTWMLKMILLDSLLLPFLLASILFALYSYRVKGGNNKTLYTLIVFSGVGLGLAIFTKVPIITFIPLVGCLIYKFHKNAKTLIIWFIPVILIPSVWPFYITSTGVLDEWFNGVFYQVQRGERNFNDTLLFLFQADPVLWILGLTGGLAVLIIKRHYYFLFWAMPYILFIYFNGGIVKYFHFIELLPLLSISGGFIIVYMTTKLSLLLGKFNKARLAKIVPIAIVSAICVFGCISIGMLLVTNTNETYFELSSFVSNNIVNAENENNEKITLVGQHWVRSFSWIPFYLYDKEHYIKDVFPERYLKEPLKTDRVMMVVDRSLKHELFDYSIQGKHLDELRKIYVESERIGLFPDDITNKYNINQYPFTSMKENNGFGLIEVRSNYENMAFALTADVTSNETSDDASISQQKMPRLKDPNLDVQVVASGLNYPTSMAFVGEDDLLVLEKNNGTIKRMVNGSLLKNPVLDLNVANKFERGLLGIAVSNVTSGNLTYNKTYVYLYYTESTKDGSDVCTGATVCIDDTNPLGNRLYRYEWKDGNLVNPKLLLDLPAGPGADHNGGVVEVGPDGNVFVLVGDGDSCWEEEYCTGSFEDSPVNSETSNIPIGDSPVGRGGILRIT